MLCLCCRVVPGIATPTSYWKIALRGAPLKIGTPKYVKGILEPSMMPRSRCAKERVDKGTCWPKKARDFVGLKTCPERLAYRLRIQSTSLQLERKALQNIIISLAYNKGALERSLCEARLKRIIMNGKIKWKNCTLHLVSMLYRCDIFFL